jgi:hypothetical protein
MYKRLFQVFAEFRLLDLVRTLNRGIILQPAQPPVNGTSTGGDN